MLIFCLFEIILAVWYHISTFDEIDGRKMCFCFTCTERDRSRLLYVSMNQSDPLDDPMTNISSTSLLTRKKNVSQRELCTNRRSLRDNVVLKKCVNTWELGSF